MPATLDRFRGCILGVALGDALGAPFEGGVVERTVWKLLALRSPGKLRYSDDGQMTLVCAESLAAHRGFDVDDMAQRWASAAQWSRGYGPGALKILRLIRRGVPWRDANRRVYPGGSFGNGAAMRATPLALFFHNDPARLDEAVRLASSVTHAHPLGIDGGLVVARAAALALHDTPPDDLLATLDRDDLHDEYRRRLRLAREMLAVEPTPADVAAALGRSVKAHESAVTAIYLACRFHARPFEEMIAFTVALGGDVDTLAAMAGGVWGASRGVDALPPDALARLEHRDRFDAAGRDLAEAAAA